MSRSSQRLISWMAVAAAALCSGTSARAQLFSHGPKPDPAAQRAALEAQSEIRQSLDQFGTQCCQILQIPSTSFKGANPTVAYGSSSSGYIYPMQFINGALSATVTLPSGAGLDFLDLYYYDNDPTNDICVDLFALTGTNSPGSTLIATTCSEASPGYGYISNAASGTINNDVAYGGGGQYLVSVYDFVASTNLQFKAVDIWWHRQVSPAPGVATFNDVPTNHPFFQFVEALAASGISAGCQASPPMYCPDAPLTRKQMAVFLSKGFGLYWRY